MSAFGRLYFRQLFTQLPEGTALVIDNFQEVAEHEALHEALCAGLSEVPPSHLLVVISRTAPASRYARHVGNRQIKIIDWDLLKLTREETGDVVRATQRSLSQVQVDRLHEASGGWAAGVTLMMERLARTDVLEAHVTDEARETTFNYFADQVFDRAQPQAQQVLLACAFLPHVSATHAVQLTGHPDAGDVLEDLCRRNLFTHRRAVPGAVYQFHALFREFLLRKANEWYTAEGQAQILRSGARVALESGDLEIALSLFLQAAENAEAARLVRTLASAWLAQGRHKTLLDWIHALPLPVRESDPWLYYWCGSALLPTQQSEARLAFGHALESMRVAGDSEGQLACVCGIMEAHFLESIDFRRLAPWTDELERLLQMAHANDSTEIQVRVLTNLTVAAVFVRLKDCDATPRARRLLTLLHTNLSPAVRIVAAHALLRHYVWSGEFQDLPALITLVQKDLNANLVSSLDRFLWHHRLAHAFLFAGNQNAAHNAERQAQLEADVIPYHPIKATLATFRVSRLLLHGDIQGAQEAASIVRTLARPELPLERGVLAIGDFHLACYHEQWEAALQAIRAAIAGLAAAGAATPEVEFGVGLVHLLWKLRHRAQAQSTAREIRARIEGGFLEHFASGIALVEAEAALAEQDLARASELLKEHLPRMRDPGWFMIRMIKPLYSRIFAHALREDLHPSLTRTLIKRFALTPHAGDEDCWPIPVKIYSLGAFRLELSQQLGAQGKLPRKLQKLLQIILAFGGDDVPAGRIIDVMWPDTEGDIARRNLDVYLTRLRKALGHSGSVQVRGGNVHLPPDVVWVDAWAFERRCQQLLSAPTEHGDTATWEARVLSLYGGHFLRDQEDEAWIVASRMRLHGLWKAAVQRSVSRLQDKGASSSARDLIARAEAIEAQARM